MAFWTLIEDRGRRSLYRCSCGTERLVLGYSVRSGRSRSCGCETRAHARGGRPSTHGLTEAPEYNCWKAMKRRCLNPSGSRYDRYGGRGITICDRWKVGDGALSGLQCFVADMGPRPSRGHTIDRIDNDGNYEPSNCRWATARQQCRNMSTTRMVKVGGEVLALVDAAERYGVAPNTIRDRMGVWGWDVDRAVTTPVTRGPTGKQPTNHFNRDADGRFQ